MSDVELIWDLKTTLGEGPVWSARERCVWFVDIKQRKLHRYGVDDGGKSSFDTPDQTGFALPAEDGSLICGVRGGLHRFEPATGRFEMILAVEEDRPQNRLNDGFVAPDGALWFGSMDDSEAGKTGALYRWAGGKLERKDDGYGVTNGPALSPDGRTLYHNDTLDKKTYAFDCAEGGVLSNKRLFATMEEGFCDGPSVDSAGTVHIGLFNGWGIARFAPDGTSLGKIEMPVPAITKAVFGDDDLKTLYITTARLHQSDEQLAQTPAAGGLFRLRVDTPGQAQNLIKL